MWNCNAELRLACALCAGECVVACVCAEEGAARPEGVPPGIPKVTSAAIVADTLGQNRPFSPAQVAFVKQWTLRLAEAINKHEQAAYVAHYHHVQAEKAKHHAESKGECA